MTFSRGGLIAVSFAALLAGGCSTSERLASSQPEPLTPAPSGTVSSNQLPPPAAPGTNPSQFPSAPGTTGTNVAAATPPAAAEPPAGAADVTTASVAGVWNATVSGQSCKVATPQTKFGAGFRAGPLRCPAPLDGVKSWNVSGKQLALYDADGGVLARLYSSGGERFDGQTSSGVPISLSR
jgi:protease inhibitor Inh